MQRRYILYTYSLILSIAACNMPRGEAPQYTISPPLETAAPSTTTQAYLNETSESDIQSPETVTAVSEQGTTETQICQSDAGAVVLIVDYEIISDIRRGLTRFEEDLCRQGFQVFETSGAFTTPVELRTYLSELYVSTGQSLMGAYLIGDFPHAYQWYRVEYANPDIPPNEQEVISFQYYSDLDGIFTVSAEYTSPGDHLFSFDIHEGDMDWEIWVSLLPLYRGDTSQTTQAINRYFEKNHAYRQGEYNLPRAFLGINELQTAATRADHDYIMRLLRSGEYAWTPFSEEDNAQIYFNSPTAGLTVEQGYRSLSEGAADFTAVSTHGTWQSSGSIDTDWVESNPVETVFFITSGCSTGDLDHEENFITSALYSPTSLVLVAWGTTSDAGGMGSNADGSYCHNIAADLSEGKSFGDAILEHVNTPLVHPYSEERESHFAVQVFLGDPSLTLFP
ncbi:MAG: hypothetical protein JXA25_19895 [Anaerolineales bacterium]|nr:hypothetical protein [Anaerolineales bacterium]